MIAQIRINPPFTSLFPNTSLSDPADPMSLIQTETYDLDILRCNPLATYYGPNSQIHSLKKRQAKAFRSNKSLLQPYKSEGIKNGKHAIFRRGYCKIHRIATMFYDEPQHELYIGYSDG